MAIRRNEILTFLLISTFNAMLVAQDYDLDADITEGCTPLKVKFTFINNTAVDTIKSYYWDFGNGQTSILPDPDTVIYNTGGIYTVSLVLDSSYWIIKTDLLTVHRTVQADFIYEETKSYDTYVFRHTDVLDNSVTYNFLWDFEGVGTRTEREESVTFPGIDTFQVSLTVTDSYGCTSISSQVVVVLEEIQVQNVFTPNGDNDNDFFVISSNGAYPLNLKIFTRAGILVFENEGYTITWDGRTASGQELKQGIYFYVLEALSGDPSKKYSKSGVVYLYK